MIPCGTCRDEEEHADEWREETDIGPRQLFKPAEQSHSSLFPPRCFKGGEHGEGSHQRRYDNDQRQNDVYHFPACGNTRLHQLMVESDRHGEQKQRDKSKPSERIAEYMAADDARNADVPGDIRRHQPEVHQRMAEEPEQGTAEHDVNARCPAQRPGNKLEQNFDSNRNGCDQPQNKSRDRHVDEQRRQLASVFPSPFAVAAKNRKPAKPAPDNQERSADVEVRRRLQRRVKGVENGSVVRNNRHDSHCRPDRHQHPSCPAEPAGSSVQRASRRFGYPGQEESDDEIRRKNKCH